MTDHSKREDRMDAKGEEFVRALRRLSKRAKTNGEIRVSWSVIDEWLRYLDKPLAQPPSTPQPPVDEFRMMEVCLACGNTKLKVVTAPQPPEGLREALEKLLKHAKAFLKVMDDVDASPDVEDDIEEKLKEAIAEADAALLTTPQSPDENFEVPEWLRAELVELSAKVQQLQRAAQCSKRAAPQPPEEVEWAYDLQTEQLQNHSRGCIYGSADGYDRVTDCTCGLKWRQMYKTAMTERAAWEKRAYEAEAALQPPETGWLIERDGPEWLASLDVPADWTRDSLEAIRFARRRDADKVAEVLENADVRITGHEWIGPAVALSGKEEEREPSLLELATDWLGESGCREYYGEEDVDSLVKLLDRVEGRSTLRTEEKGE